MNLKIILLIFTMLASVFTNGNISLNNHMVVVKHPGTNSTESESFNYFIYDRKGNCLEKGVEPRFSPVSKSISSSVLQVDFFVGSSARLTKFYNLDKGTISDEYYNIIWTDGSSVLYPDSIDDQWYIILKDIFQQTVISKTHIDYCGAIGFFPDHTYYAEEEKVYVWYYSCKDSMQCVIIDVGVSKEEHIGGRIIMETM